MTRETPFTEEDVAGETRRLRLSIRGAVQGVGFRPFIYRLASELYLSGFVSNTPQGVVIEIEQSPDRLDTFLKRLPQELPPRAFIQSLESSYLDAVGYKTFEIRKSDESGGKAAYILPDIATCPECLRDIIDSGNRRYRYPFTNCTNCGPRYTIIESLPYDRANTTMKSFVMCRSCREEYENPLDRRFHAQPNACPACGPQLELWDRTGKVLAREDDALMRAAAAIRERSVVALKGLGGFHLLVDARSESAVALLRQRKRRVGKPFALMYPSIELITRDCDVDDLERRILTSIEAPIVLVRKRPDSSEIADSVAPGNPYLGVMLPYTPLHHLLMREVGFPLVATSGNLAEEPICTDEREALRRLDGIADLFLVHDRPIKRHVDDSIVRVVAERPQVLRRARGYAPLPITLPEPLPASVAVGAHLKNSVAISLGSDVFCSQHIGDLESAEAYAAFENVLTDLQRLYEHEPVAMAHDLHPDYLSTQKAVKSHQKTVAVQHHYAHILSCMAENEVTAPALGVSWDGTGYGSDGTIWGGEFLLINDHSFVRTARLRPFPLAGGEAAIREPRRSALGLLYAAFGESLFEKTALSLTTVFTSEELRVLTAMLKNNVNSPLTSSVGRLFDAVASIVRLCQKATFEGQAAMAVEYAADGLPTDDSYPFGIGDDGSILSLDWQPMIERIMSETAAGAAAGVISARFQNTLVEMIVAVAKQVKERRVVLSGGCFQNRYLTERSIKRLAEEGFRVYWHQRVPPNDGGIALGQIVAAARQKDVK